MLLDACRDPQAHSQLPKEKERSGVDPKKVYEMYSSDLRKQTPAKEPVSREDFYRTDLGCYAEICRMSKPPKMKASACVHASGQGDGDDKSDGKGGKEKGDGEGTFTVTLDQAETDKLVKDGIGVALREAHNGNRVLKDDLLDHMDASEGSESASKTWGEHAVGALRGETPKFRKIQFWDQWLFNKLGEKLVEGDRLVYLRKLWWDPSVRFRGDKPKKRGIIIVDTSGSMSQKVLDRVAERCGEEEGLEIEWACFDHDVYPFVPGEPFRGGGGTSFQICSDYVDDLEEQVDFVLMVTDGYAPQPEVKEPEKWVWLITPGGDSSWLESHPLFSNDFWELTEEDLA